MNSVVAFTPRAVTLPGDIVSLCQQYLTDMAVKNYQPNTLTAYRIDLEQFTGYCGQRDVSLVQHVTNQLIDDYLTALLQGEGLRPRTVARKLETLRGLLRFSVRRGLISTNPGDDVTPPRWHTAPVIAPDADVCMNIIESIAVDTPLGIRDRALFTLMYEGALRVSSLINLDLHDPNNPPANAVRPNGLINYVAKGGRAETSCCGEVALRRLDAWLRIRHGFANRNTGLALFISMRGLRISRASVLARIKLHAEAINVTDMTNHKLRHRRGGEVLEKAGVRAASSLLGHKSPSVTMNVYGHHDPERTRHQVRELAPVEWGG